jgi:hypothetical protein
MPDLKTTPLRKRKQGNKATDEGWCFWPARSTCTLEGKSMQASSHYDTERSPRGENLLPTSRSAQQ